VNNVVTGLPWLCSFHRLAKGEDCWYSSIYQLQILRPKTEPTLRNGAGTQADWFIAASSPVLLPVQSSSPVPGDPRYTFSEENEDM